MIRFLEIFTEVLAWLGIVISFTLLGGIIGALLYLIIADTAALIIGIISRYNNRTLPGYQSMENNRNCTFYFRPFTKSLVKENEACRQ